MRVALKSPFEFGGVTITGIELRPAKAKDMVRIADHIPALTALDAGEGEEADLSKFSGAVVQAMIEVVSTLSDIPLAVAGELTFSDLIAVGTEAFRFLVDRESAGEG